MSVIAPTLQSFFTDRLAEQRRASARTVAVYRDSLRLLVVFVHHRTGKPPCSIDWDDLDVEIIGAFLLIQRVLAIPPKRFDRPTPVGRRWAAD